MNDSNTPTARVVGQLLLLVALLSAAVIDIVWQARAVLFSFDEIVNVDSALNLFLRGDYTTQLYGGFPFDPTVSSGLLTTWSDAIVLLAGGSLFEVRVISRLLQLALTIGLAVHFLTRWGVARSTAAIIALASWLALLSTVDVELRTATRGELWGALMLATGVCLMDRRPRLASFALGLSVWLCKLIYLPFAVAFLAAHILDHTAGRALRELRLREAGIHVSLFLLPLALWMGIIWISHDTRTVVAWIFTQVTFVLRHSTDISLSGLPSLPGWGFHPAWGATNSFLAYPLHATLPFLAPIALGLLLLGCRLCLALLGVLALSANERRVLVASGGVTVLFVVWFLAVDPTQWGRHLLPAVYIAIGLGFYSTTVIVMQPGFWSRTARAVAVAVCIGTALWSSVHLFRDIRANQWKASYALSCVGRNLSTPECMAAGSFGVLQSLVEDICPHVGGNINDVCLIDERARFVEAILAPLREEREDRQRDSTAGYLLKFFQARAYRDRESYLADLRPLVCPANDERLRERLAAVGIDVSAERLGC